LVAALREKFLIRVTFRSRRLCGMAARDLRWRTDMLSIRIVTAGAVLAFAVSAAAAQDSDAPGQPGSLLKMLMHSSEPTTAPQTNLEAKHASTKTVRTARHFHHHATRVATAAEDPTTEPAPAPAIEQTPTLEPASWSARAAIDAAPPSIWPAGNAPTFAGVLDSEPQVAAAEPSLSSNQDAVADILPAPAVAAALEDNSDDSRDAWFEEILATLGGALAAGAVAWFLFGAAPQRMYG
jgi:hypothetical protein